MALQSLSLEDLLALVRFLLSSASPPPSATQKLLLNLRELLSEQNLPLPEDVSQASSKFLSCFSATVPNLPVAGPVCPLQDRISHLLTPATTTPEPSQSPEVAQSPDITSQKLIIRLPARRPPSPSLSFSKNRNVRRRLDSNLLQAPKHPETDVQEPTEEGRSESAAACSAQRSPHPRSSKSGTRIRQRGAPAPLTQIGPIQGQHPAPQRNGKQFNKRGALSRDVHPMPSDLAEKQNLCSVGRGILVVLGALAEETVLMENGDVGSGNFISVQGLMHRLVTGPMEPTILYKSNSLDSDLPWKTLGRVAQVCYESEMLDNFSHLHYWINVMQFASLVVRETIRLEKSKTDVYEEASNHVFSMPGRCLSIATLKRYCNDGTRAILLAGAGSLYIIILLACGTLRPELRKLTGDTIERLAKILRYPSDSPDGRTVKSKIIPCIALLRKKYPLRLRILFQHTFLRNFCSNSQVDDVDCTDIGFTDNLFDRFLYNAFTRTRDLDSWKPALDPIPSAQSGWLLNPLDIFSQVHAFALPLCPLSCVAEPPLSPLTTADHSETELLESLPIHQPSQSSISPLSSSSSTSLLLLIDTNFNPRLSQNLDPPYPRDKDYDRYPLTECERTRAAKAVVATSVSEFSKKLSDQLSSGVKTNSDSYLKVDTSLLEGKILRINDIDRNPLAHIISNMPGHLRSSLLDCISLIYPDRLMKIDSRDHGDNQDFYHAIHFDWYNRYTTRGDGMDPNSDPATLFRNGKRLKNSSQNIPRASEELKKNSEQWLRLQIAFAPVFEWIRAMLKKVFPEEYENLSHFIDILPCNDVSPVHPFSGFVLNLNVTTLAHRDPCDDKICLVLVISDCEGGDLCFIEPGLVLGLRSGDMIVFRSTEITHFNAHFSGLRVSFVLHTDKDGASWVKDFNGWEGNTNINTDSSDCRIA